MLDAENPVQSEIAASALDWWAEAGVDTMVDEVPTPWLARGKRPATIVAPQFEAPPPPPAAPRTLDGFREAMLALSALDLPLSQRILASGNAASDLMVLIDMPEPGDAEAGHLLSGEAGILFDRMLAAIGRDRHNCYIAAFCPGRLPGGMIADPLVATLTPLGRQHVALIGPKRVWAMGQTVSRALIGADARPGIADLRNIHHEGGNVAAVASFSPRILLQHPKRKAAAWADMQELMRGMTA